MKTIRNIRESNISAGVGVRGFGDVSGTPATTDDTENSHIQRVVLGATEYSQEVQNYIDKHNSSSILDEPDDNWWAKAGSKGSLLTGLGKVKAKLSEENGGGVPANAAGSGNIAGLGVGVQGEPGVLPKARKNYKKRARESFILFTNMLRRKKLVTVGQR